MIVGLIGTTITPWMQFYLQAAVVEKGVDARHYGLCRLDVIMGCIVTDVIAFFIVVACGATIYHSNHHEINRCCAGRSCPASIRRQVCRHACLRLAWSTPRLLSAAILPLATSYNICEGLGFESGIDKRFSEAPIFYWLYTLLIGGGAAFVLIPNLPLLEVHSVLRRWPTASCCPSSCVYMLLLVNRPRLMGSFKNKPWQNVVAWGTAVIMIVLTAVLVYNTVAT